ncbi:unnamed protein product, partial [Heterosigma akashiwo]
VGAERGVDVVLVEGDVVDVRDGLGVLPHHLPGGRVPDLDDAGVVVVPVVGGAEAVEKPLGVGVVQHVGVGGEGQGLDFVRSPVPGESVVAAGGDEDSVGVQHVHALGIILNANYIFNVAVPDSIIVHI